MPVITSAGALIDGLSEIKAKKIAIITPYMKPLTQLVVDYIENEGIEVVDAIALEISDNIEVGRRSPDAPAEIAKKLKISNADAIVASACVQMPSLSSIEAIEKTLGLPTLSASVCTTFGMLRALGLREFVPGAGTLLNGSQAMR